VNGHSDSTLASMSGALSGWDVAFRNRPSQGLRFIRKERARIWRRHNSLCTNELTIHPTNSYLVSWIARIFSLKNSRSRNPYACRFIVLILLFVPSIGPLLIITS
jgi:hypothetical protein